MPMLESLEDSPLLRLQKSAAQIREHLAGFERAIRESGGGDAARRHLDQLAAWSLQFEADGQVYLMKRNETVEGLIALGHTREEAEFLATA